MDEVDEGVITEWWRWQERFLLDRFELTATRVLLLTVYIRGRWTHAKTLLGRIGTIK